MTERQTIAFEKWQGLGNDFILVSERALDDAQVRALCDRRLGVGADGVLLIDQGDRDRPRMTVRNADGSRPEMCGNGLRCVAGFLGEQLGEGATPRAMVVATDAGERPCALRRNGPGDWEVEVDMGRAVVDGELEVPFEGRVVRFASVDMGNPHMVTFDAVSPAERDRLAPRVERLPPRGTNVELCALREGGGGVPVIELVVWERGVGYTQACGTGACAAVVAAARATLVPFGAPVRVELPGGALEIAVERGTLAVSMKGPARRAFTGVAVLG